MNNKTIHIDTVNVMMSPLDTFDDELEKAVEQDDYLTKALALLGEARTRFDIHIHKKYGCTLCDEWLDNIDTLIEAAS